MLKKAALSLFGLAVMLVGLNPPQAHAGVVVSLGPVYPRPVYVVRTRTSRPCLMWPMDRILMPTGRYTFAPTTAIVVITVGTITGGETGTIADSNIVNSNTEAGVVKKSIS